MALPAMRARPRRGISSSTWPRRVRISISARYGGQAPINSSATVEFAPTWLVAGRIPDRPGAGQHRFATDCITGWTVSGRHQPDSDLCSASGGWGIGPITDGITEGTAGADRHLPFRIKLLGEAPTLESNRSRKRSA
jgi:hypothetical protein